MKLLESGLQNHPGTLLHSLPDPLLVLFARTAQIFVEFVVELALLNLHEVLTAQVKEELRAFVVCHYFLDREDRVQSNFAENSDQMAQVCLLWHLQHYFC